LPDAYSVTGLPEESCRSQKIFLVAAIIERTFMGLVLLIILILALVGGLPRWGYSRSWGYGPSGGLGFILLIVIILMLMGRL
jgi:hypothetical protein